MEYKVDVKGLEAVQRKKEQMVRDLHGTPMLNGMRDATLLVVRDAKIGAPVFTGHLRNSITPDVETEGKSVVGRVGSNLEYAPYQELGTGVFAGRGRYFPPPAALETWAQRHGTTGFVVARAIFQRGGLRPKKFLQKAFEKNQDKIKDLIGNVVSQIVRK